MIDGMAKMEAMRRKAGVRKGNMEGEEPARKRARAGNNPPTSCKCGALDHQRVSSKNYA
jgi:hypothetical protein